MKTLKEWLKSKIKKFLLLLIKQLDSDIPVVPKIRLKSSNIFKKEIAIPSWFTIIVTFVCSYIILVVQIAQNYMQMLGLFVFLFTLFLLIIFYFKYETKKINLDNNKVIIIAFIFIVSLLLLQICYKYVNVKIVFPLSAFTVLIALLVSVRVSVVYSLFMSILFIFIDDFVVVNSLIHLVGSLVSVINIGAIRSRAKFIGVGINIFLLCFFR